MYRGVTGERHAWVDEVRSFVYIDNPGGSGTWYSWDADARMSAERYTGILLFSFKLVHVPATKHTAPDGLSRRDPQPDDPPRDEEYEDWIDKQYAFCFSAQSPTDTESTLPEKADYTDQPLIPRSEKAIRDEETIGIIQRFLSARTFHNW